MNMLQRHALCAVVCAFAMVQLAGCSRQSQPNAGPSANLASTSSFPVYQPSTIVNTGKYDDSLEVTRFGSSFFGAGPTAAYPYVGTQELIKTDASLADLESWLKKLMQAPPEGLVPGQGLTDQEQGSSNSATSAPNSTNAPFLAAINAWGLVPYLFWNKEHNRVVMLFVLDPKALANHMGPTLGLMDEWEKMPALVRSGIDATLKKEAGLSASDLMDPSTPIGMIAYVARNWKDQNTRAIILIDATRQPNPLPTPHETTPAP
jgi:hypothetical protein